MTVTSQSITSPYAFTDLLEEPPCPRRLLHYYRPSAPFAPALYGESAPAGSWAAAPKGDSVTVAGYPIYEVCPVCQVRRSYQGGIK